jgi:hypothetical protein
MKSISAFLLFLILSASVYSQTTLKVGQRVEVNVSAHWYKSTILGIEGDKYRVHYDGYSSADDQWVHFTQIRRLAGDGNAVKVNCDFNPPAGIFSNNSPASDALFKRKLYDYYNLSVNGTLSRPVAIGITFNSFTRGTAFRNTVANVPGRGATRRHSGAPVNTTIYPVRASYMVCEKYKDGSVSQKEVNADFSFFISKDGEWTSSKDN